VLVQRLVCWLHTTPTILVLVNMMSASITRQQVGRAGCQQWPWAELQQSFLKQQLSQLVQQLSEQQQITQLVWASDTLSYLHSRCLQGCCQCCIDSAAHRTL
jgi:hypothetical protein